MTEPIPRDEAIGVSELAKVWRVSPRQARRRMLDIERRHPGTVIRGARGALRAKPEALAPFVDGVPEPRVVVEVRMLRARVGELEQRVDAKAKESLEFQRLANQWFRRLEALENKR